MTHLDLERPPLVPFFSVIVPTYQRPASLEKCLAALSQLSYPRDRFEVIVVNDGDRTLPATIIEPYQPWINVQLLHQENTGPAGARNAGASRARGEFLAFTDDDCRVLPDWLSQFAQGWQAISQSSNSQLRHAPGYALGGCTLNALPQNLYSTASQLHGDAVYAYFNQIEGQATFFASCNFSVPRLTYQQLGGFDDRFPIAAAEDREFCDRWLRAGYAMTYLPAARVHHAHHLTLASFLKQHFNYGRGAFFFHQSRQRAIEQNAADPIETDLAFYWHLISYPFQTAAGQWPFHRAFALSSLFVACNLAKTVGFYWQWFLHLFVSNNFETLPRRSSKSMPSQSTPPKSVSIAD